MRSASFSCQDIPHNAFWSPSYQPSWLHMLILILQSLIDASAMFIICFIIILNWRKLCQFLRLFYILWFFSYIRCCINKVATHWFSIFYRAWTENVFLLFFTLTFLPVVTFRSSSFKLSYFSDKSIELGTVAFMGFVSVLPKFSSCVVAVWTLTSFQTGSPGKYPLNEHKCIPTRYTFPW